MKNPWASAHRHLHVLLALLLLSPVARSEIYSTILQNGNSISTLGVSGSGGASLVAYGVPTTFQGPVVAYSNGGSLSGPIDGSLNVDLTSAAISMTGSVQPAIINFQVTARQFYGSNRIDYQAIGSAQGVALGISGTVPISVLGNTTSFDASSLIHGFGGIAALVSANLQNGGAGTVASTSAATFSSAAAASLTTVNGLTTLTIPFSFSQSFSGPVPNICSAPCSYASGVTASFDLVFAGTLVMQPRVSAVPEPSSLALIALGGLFLGGERLARRQRRWRG